MGVLAGIAALESCRYGEDRGTLWMVVNLQMYDKLAPKSPKGRERVTFSKRDCFKYVLNPWRRG